MAEATAPPAKYPAQHLELLAIFASTLVDEGLEPSAAQNLSLALVDRMRSAFGGHKIYMARSKYTVEYMRAEIKRRWVGQNTLELCRELDIGENRLRQLHAEVLDEKVA